MTADYSIQVLGGCSIADSHGTLIDLASRKAEAIIMYVLFSEKAACEREELATLLWAEMPESNALTNLRVTLAAIKRHCSDLLVITRRRVSLNPEIEISSDWDILGGHISEILADGHETNELSLDQAQLLSEKLPLYRGDFLQGFFIKNTIVFEDWVSYKRETIRRSVIDACQMLIHTYRKNNQVSEGITVAQTLLYIDPFNDAAHNWLIELYALNGEREKSLAFFEDYKNMLSEGIGVEPSDETLELVEDIRHGDIAVESATRKAIEKSSLPIPNNIPMELSKFFGRESELAQLRDYLHNPHMRLVTMVGQGGTGKTRLAIEAAKQNMRLFTDGVWFVRLDSVVSADLVLPEIYKVLGITYPQRDQAQAQLIEYMNGHHTLMVLDNFEHLLDASPIIAGVIEGTTNSKMIVTSREMTGLPQETNMFIDGLAGRGQKKGTDLAETESISYAGQMFIERAKRLQPGFEPDDEDISIVEDICDLVAGLPLGIELAASGLKKNTLTDLRDHIADDFTFLESDQPHLPARQRSLMSVFNTFWEQLAEDEQMMIGRLSAFCGVVTQDAAKQVAGVSIFFLSSLVSRGFLQRVGSYGYRAHSMHRQFVRKRLKQDPKRFRAISKKHRDYYFNLLERTVRPLRDSPQKVMLDELEEELCNIRSALQFTITSGKKQKALTFCELLMPFWKIRGFYQEGYHWLDQVFGMEGDANPVTESSALCAAAKLVSVLGDQETAEAYSRKSLRIAKDMGDQHGIARALNSLGSALAEKGNPQEAEEIYTESLAIYRNLRVQQAIAGTQVNLAMMEIESGKLDDAGALLDQALQSFRLVGDTVGVTHVLLGCARIDLLRQDGASAMDNLREALQKAWNLSAREELNQIFVLLAQALAQTGRFEESARMLAMVKTAVRRYKLPLSAGETEVVKTITKKTKKALGEKRFETAWRSGELDGEAKIVQKVLAAL